MIVPSVSSHAATTTSSTTTALTTTTTTSVTPNATSAPGLPLYQFQDTGAGALPWSAQSLTSLLDGTQMIGAPHSAVSSTLGAVAFLTSASHVGLFTQTLTANLPTPTSTSSTPTSSPSTTVPPTTTASTSAASTSSTSSTSTTAPSAASSTQFRDLSVNIDAEAPGADPVPFFDPWGNVDVLYVSATNDLELLSPNDPISAIWPHTHQRAAWRPTVATNLTALSGYNAQGVASVVVSGSSALVALRTKTNRLVAITLAWAPGQPVPIVNPSALNLTALTHSPVAASDPVVLSASTASIVTTSRAGHVEFYGVNPTSGAWYSEDLTRATNTARVTGPLAATTSLYGAYVTALSPAGSVILFSTPLFTLGRPPVSPPPTTSTSTSTTVVVTPTTSPASTTTTSAPNYSPWTVTNVTAAASGAPPLSGTLYLNVSTSRLTIAGSAANWGDLFVLQSPNPVAGWVATDVSVTAGNAARTVADAVSGLPTGDGFSLFAAGISSPPPQGVGVYAIPSNKWTRAVLDGWPILSETGGLGTLSAPWVGFTSAKSVATSPDYLMGRSIYKGHKRVTWLSYWTISGPLKGESQVSATYYQHGFAAGAWVAAQIDQYAGLGEGLKPDWVILDPEGYPDAHSGLDAPNGSKAATLNHYATFWSAMLSGWSAGLASVDPSLNPGVYATQSEYRNYHLASQPLPVFMAIAFGGGGPIPVKGASGANVRGFIAFNGSCTPQSTLINQEQTLANPPWAGQFNTLQFDAGVYCAPAPF